MKTQRVCGECTLCCTTHAIFELKKPAAEPCIHCELNKGCKIYNNRPRSCRGFKCMWLMGLGAPQQRPDRTGIVPELRIDKKIGNIVFLWAMGDQLLSSIFVRKQTKFYLQAGNSVVHVPVIGRPKIYLRAGINTSPRMFLGDEDTSLKEIEVVPFIEGRF